MKIALDLVNQARAGGHNGFGYVAESFDQVSAQIPAAYHTEHTLDDKHRTIHADGPIYERSRTPAMGVWQTAPFSASYFTAVTGSTWTVTATQAVAWEYMLIGSTMYVGFYIESSTIGTAAATRLFITIPGGYRAIRRMFSTFAYDDNGTRGTGVVQVRPQSAAQNAGTTLELTKDPRAVGTFSTSSSFSIFGQIAFEIYQSDTQALANESFSASGGTITTVGTKTIHTFTTSGTFTVFAGAATIDYLIVGGGGGGGVGTNVAGNETGGSGGGGAGAMLTGSESIASGSFTVTVGAGGASATSGQDSSFHGHTATGGGKGGNAFASATVGANGGSGGGGGGDTVAGKAGGTGGTGGNNGGTGGTNAANPAGAGGGGSAAVGQNAGANAGGNGGNGTANSISGSSVTYAGGGGGAGWNTPSASTDGTGGTGGAGNGSHTGVGGAATANTGSGGGGGTADGGGAGGSGIVIISYTTP